MKPVKLKNRYNGEIVYCKDIKDIVQDSSYTFIKVYKPELPERIYLVNKDAYEVLTK
jgi:hypothetical protein